MSSNSKIIQSFQFSSHVVFVFVNTQKICTLYSVNHSHYFFALFQHYRHSNFNIFDFFKALNSTNNVSKFNDFVILDSRSNNFYFNQFINQIKLIYDLFRVSRNQHFQNVVTQFKRDFSQLTLRKNDQYVEYNSNVNAQFQA